MYVCCVFLGCEVRIGVYLKVGWFVKMVKDKEYYNVFGVLFEVILVEIKKVYYVKVVFNVFVFFCKVVF